MTQLARLRKQYEISQGELATAIGLTSPQYISNVERGLCALSPEHYKPIAEYITTVKTKQTKIVEAFIGEKLRYEERKIRETIYGA